MVQLNAKAFNSWLDSWPGYFVAGMILTHSLHLEIHSLAIKQNEKSGRMPATVAPRVLLSGTVAISPRENVPI
jgi:hypothetical protein